MKITHQSSINKICNTLFHDKPVQMKFHAHHEFHIKLGLLNSCSKNGYQIERKKHFAVHGVLRGNENTPMLRLVPIIVYLNSDKGFWKKVVLIEIL